MGFSITGLRLASLAMSVLFVIAAGLQYNDPDPIQWALVYTLAALACIVHVLRRDSRIVSALVGIGSLVWAVTIAPRVIGTGSLLDAFHSMDPSMPWIEETREMLGLLIVAAWMGTLVMFGRPRENVPVTPRPGSAGRVAS